METQDSNSIISESYIGKSKEVLDEAKFSNLQSAKMTKDDLDEIKKAKELGLCSEKEKKEVAEILNL